MGEALIGVAAQVLVRNLISFSFEKTKLVRGFQEDISTLQNSLSMIQKFLSDAEEKELNDKAVKEWLEQLEDVAFKADAVLDEFNYQLLREKLNTQNREANKVSWSFSFGTTSTNLLFREKMARKIKDINSKLDVIDKGALSKGLQMRVVSARDASFVGSMETDSFSIESNIIGRENDVTKIIEMIVNAPSDDKFSVIPIVGMGGLGKTTLARQIFHDKDISLHFGKKIWVCVSSNFDERTLFQMILKTLTGEDVQGIMIKEVVLEKIQKVLAGKRYLLVLDDVWNEDFKKWEDFKRSLSGISNVKQNAIIVTTRNEYVASVVETVLIYRLRSLSDDDCWSIIKAKALSSVDDPLDFKEVGKSIAQRCGGLPLAADVVGGLLRGKPKEEWSFILKNQLSKFDRDGNPVVKILKLSYDRLPSSSLKKCFIYCSVFPQDFEIGKKNIIEMWMAEGFLQANDENDSETVGTSFFNHLLQTSLIQASKRDDFGNITHCRMHDLVHDLACSISGLRSLSVKDSAKDMNKVRYLYLKADESYYILKERTKYLRTLVFNGKVLDNFLSGSGSGSSSLHVLILTSSSITELPIGIGKQIHLRLLDISSTRIKYLPNSVSKLSNLQTLAAPNLEKLPNSIVDLFDLRHLYISSIELPPCIGKLTSLQTLPYYKVGHDRHCRIEELGNLKNLKGELKIQDLERVNDKQEAEHASLLKKPNISKLVLMWKESRNGEINDENVLEGLQPHPNLKSLEIHGYESKNFASWTVKMTIYNETENRLVGLTNLVHVKLYRCSQCEEIPNLGHLPRLKFLEIEGLCNVRSMGFSFYGLDCTTSSVINHANVHKTMTLFPALQKLHLLEMPNLMDWVDVEQRFAVFPCLEHLQIQSCPRLLSSPTRFPYLTELCIDEMDTDVILTNMCSNTTSLQSLNIKNYSGIIYLLDDYFLKNQSLSYLTIHNCPNLIGLVPQQRGDVESILQSLREFTVWNCPELKKIPYLDLMSLRALSIVDCPGLTDLQCVLQELCASSLERLYLYRLQNVKNLESVIPYLSRMSHLEYLSLFKLPKLVNLPTEICRLGSLRELEIGGFSESIDVSSFNDFLKCVLHENYSLLDLTLYGNEDWDLLPDQIRHLTGLKYLHLYDFGMEALPEWIELLSSLRKLCIYNTKRLMHMPSKEAMQRLTKLEYLSIHQCPLLKERYSRQQSTTTGHDSEWQKISNISIVLVDGQRLPTKICEYFLILTDHDLLLYLPLQIHLTNKHTHTDMKCLKFL